MSLTNLLNAQLHNMYGGYGLGGELLGAGYKQSIVDNYKLMNPLMSDYFGVGTYKSGKAAGKSFATAKFGRGKKGKALRQNFLAYYRAQPGYKRQKLYGQRLAKSKMPKTYNSSRLKEVQKIRRENGLTLKQS